MRSTTDRSRRKCWPSARRAAARGRPVHRRARDRRARVATRAHRRACELAQVGEERARRPRAPARSVVRARARVVDDVVGQLGLLGHRHLARDAGARGLLGRTPSRAMSRCELGGGVGDHHHHLVHLLVAARLDQQRGVPDHEAVEALPPRRRPGCCSQPRADRRMRDRPRAASASLGVREDDGAELACGRAGRRAGAHPSPNSATICGERGRPRLHDLAGEASASTTRTPRCANIALTVLLPVAMPPVRPTRRKRLTPRPSRRRS